MYRPWKTEYHVTPEQVKDLLDYNPETGIFTWKFRSPATRSNNTFNANYAGLVAGGASEGHSKGYIRIKVHGKMLKAHRAAFAVMEGKWPEGFIDHIDGNPQNNAWDNLRVADKIGNGRNQKLYSSNTSGVVGVHFNNSKGLWIAQIGGNGSKYFECLGSFKEKEDAVAARKKAEERLNYHENHGTVR